MDPEAKPPDASKRSDDPQEQTRAEDDTDQEILVAAFLAVLPLLFRPRRS